MVNTKTVRLALLLIVVFGLGTVLVVVSRHAETLRYTTVTMFDVGQGDSFFIQAKNGKQMLIDGGKDTKALAALAQTMPWGDRSIDVVVATHPDMDHIGGLTSIIARYKIGMMLVSGVGGDTKEYEQLLTLVQKKRIPLYVARAGMEVALSDTDTFTVLFPDRDVHDWETNTGSVVGKFTSGERSILFTGDSPAPIEQYLVKKQSKNLDIDILKLGHHGSRTSTTAALLKVATPDLALISAGRDNSYGHPHKEVLTLLKQFSIPYVSTQTEGTVTFETDGTKWWRK